MAKSIVERIAIKRMQLGNGKNPLALDKTAVQIGISTSSLRSVVRYGELAVGDTIRPKLEAWLKKEGEK